ncbi:MAG: class F sortase [Gemmatimonadota bacterium]
MADAEWRRIAGFRVVMSWPQAAYAPPPATPVNLRARVAGMLGAVLLTAGAIALLVAAAAQVHAPLPSLAAAGAIGPSGGRGPLHRSLPVAIDIPAIGVHSRLLHLGLSTRGTMQVPSLATQAGQAAWYRYSATPGQLGASVIEGHVDTYVGPAVFFRLGALRPGNKVEVRLADGVTAVFRVTGVRLYAKTRYPAQTIYRAPGYPALRLVTCGGAFDYATRSYRSSVVVFAALASSRPPG